MPATYFAGPEPAVCSTSLVHVTRCDRRRLDSTACGEQTTVTRSRQLGGALQRIRNGALIGLGLILFAVVAFATPAASAPAALSSDAQDLLARTNALRAGQGA